MIRSGGGFAMSRPNIRHSYPVESTTMRLYQGIRASIGRSVVVAGCAILFASGLSVSAFGQGTSQTVPPVPTQPPTTPQPAAPTVQRVQDSPSVASGMPITMEEAVRMSLENNLGIKAERYNPELQALVLARANAAYAPALISSVSQSSNAAPPSDFLSSGVSVINAGNFQTQAGVQQNVKWGGASYQVTWNGLRSTSDAPRVSFSPEISSSMTAIFNQPLLRNFRIDSLREQLRLARSQGEFADIGLRQRITQTAHNVRAAYYTLVGAIAGLSVAQQSLDLSRESLRQNQKRVDVGTMAPIDIISAEAEVASNEEGVIIQQAAIDQAQDQLRTIVMNQSQPQFWTVTFKPTDQPVLQPHDIDVDAAVNNALKSRSDILQFQKQMDQSDVAINFAKNQKLPEIDLQGRYGATALGGTQYQYDYNDLTSIAPIGSSLRSFGSVLSDLVNNDFRNWAVAVNVTYPLGQTQANAAYAQAKVTRQQQATQLEDLKTQVTAQVRNAARNVNSNLKRVEVTQRARELAQRSVDAEQKRFDVGLSTTFELIQKQRDLAAAKQRELSATIDYNRSLVDFEAVQQVPIF
jgi:outer membrane protein TolC